MLKPTAVQATLKALLESPSVPADSALVVFSESGTIYAQAHSDNGVTIASSSKLDQDSKPKTTESQRLQFLRQPGLVTLLGSSRTKPVKQSASLIDEEKIGSAAAPMMELALDVDGRAKILAALACQSWLEETNRVRRLFTKIYGHIPVSIGDNSDRIRSLSTSTGGNGSGNGNGKIRMKRVEQNGLHRIGSGGEMGDSQLERKNGDQDLPLESVTAPVVVPGTLLSTGTTVPSVAPLLSEGELGALLIMPLYHQPLTSSPSSPNLPQNSSPLLLVLAARPPTSTDDTPRARPGMGSSLLSQLQWNQLYDAAKIFANHVSPSLRKAFGREGIEVVGDAISQSDLESSVDFEAATTTIGTGIDQGLGVGISVR